MSSMFAASKNGKAVMVVVLHSDTMERLVKSDPTVMLGTQFAEALAMISGAVNAAIDTTKFPIGLVDVLIAYEPDEAAFVAKVAELGSANDVLEWLGRGWQNKPEDAMVRKAVIGKGYSKPGAGPAPWEKG